MWHKGHSSGKEYTDEWDATVSLKTEIIKISDVLPGTCMLCTKFYYDVTPYHVYSLLAFH